MRIDSLNNNERGGIYIYILFFTTLVPLFVAFFWFFTTMLTIENQVFYTKAALNNCVSWAATAVDQGATIERIEAGEEILKEKGIAIDIRLANTRFNNCWSRMINDPDSPGLIRDNFQLISPDGQPEQIGIGEVVNRIPVYRNSLLIRGTLVVPLAPLGSINVPVSSIQEATSRDIINDKLR